MKQVALAVLICALAAPADAQKKPRAPSAADPEIAFVDTKSRYPEVKLANADLTGAFSVFRSAAQYMMPRYDLSPRGQKQVAVTSGGTAQLVSWSSNESVVTVTSQPLVAPAGGASSVTFSPDGTKIAVYYEADRKVRIFDAASRQIVAQWPTPFVFWMTYYGDGSKIAFIVYGEPKIFELDDATGSIATYDFAAGSLQHLGDGHGSDALLVGYRTPDGQPEDLYIGRWEAGQLTEVRIAQGWDAKYNCSETKVVYRAVGNAPPTYVYNLENGLSSLLTRNTDVRRVDFVPTC